MLSSNDAHVSHRQTPTYGTDMAALGGGGGPRGHPWGGEMGSHGPPQAPIFFETFFLFARFLTAQDKRVAKGSARKAPASQTRYH